VLFRSDPLPDEGDPVPEDEAEDVPADDTDDETEEAPAGDGSGNEDTEDVPIES
jgi:hypothetical protein